ncbi:MAG: type I DNA topoisomerase [Candidatus Levybacteria bacterium]|nr:type I DNA topoisomerase [Candidatus Levybacteria bacterium]
MSTLVLVESPTKARTLTRFFGDKYDVEASIGHIRDLPRGDIGVDIENNFEPRYVTPKAKQKTLTLLKKKVKKADTVLLATDPDREGEAISYHLLEMLKPEAKKGAVFKRIVFHEITREAIEEALNNPREIDEKLVDAQIARRVLDRIVGYKVSPILWKKIKRNLSAGRVQSIALRLIVEREREIAKFNSEEYYKIFVTLKKNGKENSNSNEVQFELTSLDGKKIEQNEKLDLYDGQYTYTKTVLDEPTANKIITELSTQSYTVSEVVKKQSKRTPLPPFITSSMQIEAARKLSFNSRKTMQVAQKLYEEGYITYHRTDSFNLSNQFLTKARSFIKKEFGDKYLHDGNRIFKTKSKVAQEAHEAIRPTGIENFEEVKQKIAGELGRDGVRLYELVYKRAIATQMADALFESTKITIQTSLGHVFEKSGSVLLFDGYLKLWYREDGEEFLPEFSRGEILPYLSAQKTQHTTTPPPRYNDASLISTLEKNGIGRPSTYASIVSTILDRFYIEREENRFIPTLVGNTVSDFLVKNFSDIDDIPFTAAMENKLDAIANGEASWKPMIAEFYAPLEKQLAEAENAEVTKIDLDEKTDKICPLDGGAVLIRRGRFGKFYACGNFPTCKYTARIIDVTQYKCPKDKGDVIVKKTKKGRTFFGCSHYPKCDFAVWTKKQLLKEVGITEQTNE